ncbi:hypothetical protein [Aquirufa sp. Wall-65K1]
MKPIFLLFLFISIYTYGHSPQISTFALVKDEKGRWTAHLSASSDAFQTVLLNKKWNSINEFERALIQYTSHSIRISAGFLNPIVLTDGQIHVGHHTDIKFKVQGIPKHIQSFMVENQSFKLLKDHFMVFKVIFPKSESNQLVLASMNDFTANVQLKSSGIFVEANPHFTYLYLVLFIPIVLLGIYYLKRKALWKQ